MLSSRLLRPLGKGLSQQSKTHLQSHNRRLSVLTPHFAKKLVISETEQEVVIEATPEGEEAVKQRRANLLHVPDPPCGSKAGCHPLCKLPFVDEIKHTDVLILAQFMTSDGRIIDRQINGLCKRQHKRMDKLIRMAQKAGLMPAEQDQYRHEKEDDEETPWAKLNSYYDEKTIDIQWLDNKRRAKKKSFY